MTVHWIDPSTLQFYKAVISCSRLVGHYTYDVLASKIESIYRSYGLNGNLTATITDNGSIFAKAFKTFFVTDSASTGVVKEEYCPEDYIDEEAIFENVHDTLTLENMDDLTQVEYDCPLMKDGQPQGGRT